MLRSGTSCARVKRGASRSLKLVWTPTPPRSSTSSTGTWEGVQSDTRILKELGLQLKVLTKGEVILLDGGFSGRKHGIIPWPKPKKKDHLRWQAKYNDGHSFIRGRGEHPFAQLYT